jgi:hypothetical protein
MENVGSKTKVKRRKQQLHMVERANTKKIMNYEVSRSCSCTGLGRIQSLLIIGLLRHHWFGVWSVLARPVYRCCFCQH